MFSISDERDSHMCAARSLMKSARVNACLAQGRACMRVKSAASILRAHKKYCVSEAGEALCLCVRALWRVCAHRGHSAKPEHEQEEIPGLGSTAQHRIPAQHICCGSRCLFSPPFLSLALPPSVIVSSN